MPFNPNEEYGSELRIHGRYEALTEDSLPVQLMHQHAARQLPVGAVYEIRLRTPSNYGRERAIGWIYAPGLEDLPPLRRLEANPAYGYIFFGLYRVEGGGGEIGPTEDTILGPRDSGGERTQE